MKSIHAIARSVVFVMVCAISAHSAEFTYQVDWFGNTFGVGGQQWVQHDIFDIFVKADGTVFTNSRWDEGAKEAGIYKNGQCVGQMYDTHGNWGGGFAIAGNKTHIFLGMKSGRIRKFLHNGDASGSLVTVCDDENGPMGLAVTDSLVYMSDAKNNLIKVLSASNLALIRSFSFANPGKMAFGPDGTLWITKTVNAPDDPAVYNMSIDGVPLGKKISLKGIVGLAFDRQGFLWVADNGPDQNAKKFNVAGAQPQLVDSLGVKGGILAGTPGQVSPLKFNGITGVGVDSIGNIYVACDGLSKSPWGWKGTELRAFSTTKQLLWELYGLEWIDVAAADPSNDNQVFTQHARYQIDYSKSGGTGWAYKAYTIDPYKYPDDYRIKGFQSCTQIIRVNGHKLMYLSDMDGSHQGVYRFDGEIGVPAAFFAYAGSSGLLPNQPTTQRWVWVDQNGNGSCEADEFVKPSSTARGGVAGTVDSKGNVWYLAWGGKIECWKLKGISAQGVPLYGADAVDTSRCPARIDRHERIFYDADKDEMWISGNVPEKPDPQDNGMYMPAGHAIIRVDNWSTGNRTVSLEVPISYNEGTGDQKMVAKSFALAGDYLFVSHFGKTMIKVHNRTTGELVGLMPPKDPIGTNSGDHDIPYAITATKRSNGEYIVFSEDDRFQKIAMYRYCPSGNCGAVPTRESSIFTPRATGFTISIHGRALSITGVNLTMVRVISPAGRVVATRNLARSENSIDLSKQSAGLYLVEMNGKAGRTAQRFVLK